MGDEKKGPNPAITDVLLAHEAYPSTMDQWARWLNRSQNAGMLMIRKVVQETLLRTSQRKWANPDDMPTTTELYAALDLERSDFFGDIVRGY